MSTRQSHPSANRMARQSLSRGFQRSAIALAIAALLSANAYAQDADPASEAEQDKKDEATELDTVVVTGVRGSVTKAQQIKQNAEQIVDSIVAEDIGKLPDNNVAEALQRISGIQIDRNYGEGSNIAIRGLTQVRTELNGRDIFTANDGRGLSFEDVSAELLAGVDVYKNPSAEMIEGGLGGTVNLRTRMPFDYDGMKIAGSAQYNRYDLVDKGETAFSGLFSNRWQTGIGEIGLLVNLSRQDGSFRQDTISIEPWYAQTDIPGHVGEEVFVPHGAGINTTIGERERTTSAVALQWAPNDDIEVYAQALRSDYDFTWRDYSFFAYTGGNPMQGFDNFSFNDRNEMVTGTFANTPADSNTSLTVRHSVTTDYSAGAIWNVSPELKLSTDLQYVKATTDSTRYIVATGMASTPFFHMDLSGDLPRLSVTDASGAEGYLSDPANYVGWKWHLDNKDDNQADEFAWRADMDLGFDNGFLRGFKAGVRYTDRDAKNKGNVWRFMCLNGCGGLPFDQVPGVGLVVNPFTDFFRGDGYTFGPTLSASDDAVADYEGTLAAFGGTPLSFGPNNINTQSEKTYAGYGLLRFGTDGDRPFDGNLGVRVVRTEVQSVGVVNDLANPGSFLPVDVQQSYTDVLPSLNLRWMLTDQLQWRVAMSKGVSRPGFDKLNPNLSLGVGSDPANPNRTGSGGNPHLQPMEAKQFDTSLEWYFGQGSMLYATAFYKKVDGFIANTVFDEQFVDPNTGQLETFQITRPVNGDNGKIKGIEVGYTQFFDFLPAPFDGLGVQTNYTYVDSEAPSPTATDTNGQPFIVPLEGLSKNSYNAILMYEKSRFSARLAYNWRSDWLVTTAGNGTGNLPVYNKGFGQLDASVRFNINDVWSISLDGTNLLDTRRESYLGYESRLRDFVINDRRYGITLRASL